MRQVCNVSYVAQLQGRDESEARLFEAELLRPPPGWTRRSAARSYVTPELDALMAPAGTGGRG